MKKRLRRAGVLLLIAVALAGALWVSLHLPYRDFAAETFVRFDRGSGTVAMARALEQAGVIRYAWQFWLERALHPTARLAAGEYKFEDAASVISVFGRIARGDVYYFEFSVPEGSNIFDIARLAEASGAMPAQDFLKAAGNPMPIHDLDPEAATLEGYLFPATYRLSRSTTAAELCQLMTTQFRRQWKKLLAGQSTGQSKEASVDPHRIVTLASLVEKETALAEERPLVAGVFLNRLKLSMRLECDPTTIYAALLDHRYRGAIYRSDLESRNPYNTYQRPGLPPGPIANPGAEALAAALHPAETKYLYFVAKPSGGGHQFSATLAEHDQAVRAYRRGSQEHGTQPQKPAAKATKKA
jgi:UPF0755 protein